MTSPGRPASARALLRSSLIVMAASVPLGLINELAIMWFRRQTRFAPPMGVFEAALLESYAWIPAAAATWLILMRPVRRSSPGEAALWGLASVVLNAMFVIAALGIGEYLTGRKGFDVMRQLVGVPTLAVVAAVVTWPVSWPIGIATGLLFRLALQRWGTRG